MTEMLENLEKIRTHLGECLTEDGIMNMSFQLENNPNFEKDLIALIVAYQLGVKFKTAKDKYVKPDIKFNSEMFEA